MAFYFGDFRLYGYEDWSLAVAVAVAATVARILKPKLYNPHLYLDLSLD